MSDTNLNEIKRMLIVNFIELQDIRKHLNIKRESSQDFYDYQNSVHDYVKEFDEKMRSLIKDYPHLWGGK